jgi:hypothetical protein
MFEKSTIRYNPTRYSDILIKIFAACVILPAMPSSVGIRRRLDQRPPANVGTSFQHILQMVARAAQRCSKNRIGLSNGRISRENAGVLNIQHLRNLAHSHPRKLIEACEKKQG